MNRFVLSLAIALQMVGTGAGSEAQPRNTIRAQLVEAGFSEAVAVAAAPALDEPVTSSAFAASNGMFVAAYYLQKEVEGQALGPLHVSAFDKNTGRWIHAGGLNARGSVLKVDVIGPFVLIALHSSPSAGTGLVLDATTLDVVGSLKGFNLRAIAHGEILFWANMVHFAPTHQERLMLYTPQTRLESELFPGLTPSTIASSYRQLIRSTYAALPASAKQEFETSAYGAVDDFDRTISHVIESADQRRIAFYIGYSSTRLAGKLPPIAAIGRCQRQQSHTWTCDETEFDAVARSAGIDLSRRPGVEPDTAQIEQVVRRIAEAVR